MVCLDSLRDGNEATLEDEVPSAVCSTQSRLLRGGRAEKIANLRDHVDELRVAQHDGRHRVVAVEIGVQNQV